MLTRRARRVRLSTTMRVHALAREMRARGEDLVDLSAGEPLFPTPERVKEAGKRAIEENRTGYTASEGTVELREAVAEKLRRDQGLTYGPHEILVTPGAKAALYFAAMALLEEGDEVLVPSPYYVSYPEQVRLAGARPVFVRASEASGFRIGAEQLVSAATDRTKALILNTPNNPTGACYDRDELEALAAVCLERNLWILADEIYERLVYDGRVLSSVASLGPDVQGRTVVVNGVSKAFSMTGWRIGYAAGPAEWIEAMARVQSHCTGNASTPGQWASVEALRFAFGETARMATELERRRDVMLEGIEAIPGMTCVAPAGGLCAFANVSELCRRAGLRDGAELAGVLLDRAKVVVVPGEAFGSDLHVRLSFAGPVERIREATRRIARTVSAIRP